MHTRSLVNGSLKEISTERNISFSKTDQVIARVFTPSSHTEGPWLADLRSEGTCLSGPSDMLLSW